MENQKDRMNGAFQTASEAEAHYGLSVWLGAIVFYFLSLGKRSFDELYIKKYRLRNMLVGYGLHLALAVGIILIFVMSA